MSSISKILPDIQTQNAVMSKVVFEIAAEHKFYITCNRALKALRQFDHEMSEVRAAFKHVLDEETGADDAASGDVIDDVVRRLAVVERSLASEWNVLRERLAILFSSVKESGSTRKAMLRRVMNAVDAVYGSAVILLRDGRVSIMVKQAEQDDLEEDVISTPSQLASYFGVPSK